VIRRLLIRLRKSERGATMVEFAIASLAFLTLLFGIIEFGWIFHGWITLTAAAREGARLAIVGHTEGEVKDVVKQHAPTFQLSDEDIKIIIGTRPEYKTSVTVEGNLTLPLGFFMPSPYGLTVEVNMRHER
jgi:Flp pilus assembly protein TadG